MCCDPRITQNVGAGWGLWDEPVLVAFPLFPVRPEARQDTGLSHAQQLLIHRAFSNGVLASTWKALSQLHATPL